MFMLADGSEHPIILCPARLPEEVAEVRALFLEYAKSLSFNFCFQNFERELAELPGDYAPPSGLLLLAKVQGRPAGCVALHCFAGSHDICEMKRLYVRPAFRGLRLGARLTQAVIAGAIAGGYGRMRLDTVPSEMAIAVRMYERLGFRDIAPYRENPMPDTRYMELDLALRSTQSHAEAG
jgi:putative acetyltransferase